MKLLTKLFARSKVKASTAQPSQPSQPSQPASFETRLAAVEAMAAQLESPGLTVTQADETIARLKDELQTLQARSLVQTGQLLTLQTKLESAARRANDVLAAQGLAPDELPMAEQTSGGGVAQSAWQTYCSLLQSDPRKAGEYWATNSAAILASKAKAQK